MRDIRPFKNTNKICMTDSIVHILHDVVIVVVVLPISPH